ncbi:MAG: ATP-dependent DNA helicase RecG [Xanthomonadales bacterium]|nr:ATP-dependent DNA helicase RecG [Xanthomonadales bacterium]MDH4000497.1 ATP-dependent DNA helicase RecG [Xanthomonadales bacterium]
MLASDLRELRGVGPSLESSLNQLGIHSSQDLLFHLPFRYEDRTRIHPIGALYPGARVLVEGEVEHSTIVRGRRATLVVVISDGTGRLTLRFFHFRAAQKRQFSRGTQVRCYGEVRGGYQGLDMVHPSYKRILNEADEAVSDRLTPVYPTVEGLGQASWQKLTEQALALLNSGQLELEELLPDDLRGNLKMSPLAEALTYIHRPPAGADVAALVERRHPAQQRLALEELLAHNLSVQQLHRQQRKLRAAGMPSKSTLEQTFLERLPFRLTGAQYRVIDEIHRDLSLDHPMQRLVQGDVGSGKTVVAALAALRTMGNGFQVAMMAPTELLAEQHLRSFTEWLEPLGISPIWLSGKVTGKARQAALDAIEQGAPLVIGTHALMQEGVSFGKLGLAIVDEQHRFGVHQRLALLDKAGAESLHAHQLIMTATPIPRTLAMTAYAGLETSVIDELPPGRKPVTTAVISDERRNEVVSRVAAACREGKQAYWVCTLIEESDAVQAQAAEEVARNLQASLAGIEVGLVHGRMKPQDKQQVMDHFKQGDIQLLVATTVIEVGVDVPNASLMIIENAERLGLAQLHQLRGRVGRGDEQASCVLLYSPPIGPLAKERLNIMRETTDGFRIAEKDLELRGPGEVLGTRQTGMLQFRVADLSRDQQLLESIPAVAERLLKRNPETSAKLIRRWIGDAARFAGV